MPKEKDKEATGTGTDKVDPMALSNEDFDKQKNELFVDPESAADTDMVGAPGAPASDDPAGPKEETPGQPARSDEQDGKPAEGEKDMPFSLVDEPAADPGADPDKAKPEDQELYQIKHMGEVRTVTKEKYDELAHMGYDYSAKLGPHRKLVQLIDADPGAQEVLNRYFTARLKGQDPAAAAGGAGERPAADPAAAAAANLADKIVVKPIADFGNDEEAWAKDFLVSNAHIFAEMSKPAADPATPQDAGTGLAEKVGTMLMARDAEDFPKVVPYLDDFAKRNLTIEQYVAVNSDPTYKNLFKFYDWAKPRILKATGAAPAPGSAGQNGNPTPKQETPAGNTPPLRIDSGGGHPDREKAGDKYVWELSNDQFDKELADLKRTAAATYV